MDVDDMFGGNDQEEVVEEEVPVVVESAVQSSDFFTSTVGSSTSASSVPAYSSPLSTTISNSASFGNYSYQPEEDTTAFKTWKAKHDAELEERASKEQKARDASRAAGRSELDKLLADHHSKVEKTKATNRQHEESTIQDRDAQLKKGAEWERVAGYMGAKVEREGARDTTRFREIVLNHKA